MSDTEDLAAAELALGLLDGDELVAARQRLADDPAFAAELAWWEERLAPLLDELDGAEPGPEMRERILAQVESGAANDNEIELALLRRREQRWRWTAGLTSAAAAVAFAFLAVPQLRAPGPPPVGQESEAPLMASLPIAETQLRLGVTYIPESSELLVSASGLTADGVHDHELWLVPPEGDLQSLGVVVPGEQRRIALSPDIARNVANGSQLLLTREPLGGKPADQAAGPVVADAVFSAT